MRPEIRQYLEENAPTYTPEAMRRMLLEAGHPENEVDAALREWRIESSGSISDEDRRAYRRWSAGFSVAALLLVVVVGSVITGPQQFAGVLISAVVLAVFLLVGWALSSVIATVVLPRTNLAVALAVPAVIALSLGGTCLALLDGLTGTPPALGSMEVHIDELEFDASGTAFCQRDLEPGSFSVGSQGLGTIDGMPLSVNVDRFDTSGEPNRPAPAPAPGAGGVNVFVYLNPTSESQTGASWGISPDTEVEVEVSPDGRSGTVAFQNLTPEPIGPQINDEFADPISGTLTWSCEEGN